jgi:hypothetical protein
VTVEILHDLETTSYYVDKNSPDYILRLARHIIQAILRWANMLICRLEVGCAYCFIAFLNTTSLLGYGYHCFQSCFDGTSVSFDEQNSLGNDMTYITNIIGGLDNIQVSGLFLTPAVQDCLSWDLLLLDIGGG